PAPCPPARQVPAGREGTARQEAWYPAWQSLSRTRPAGHCRQQADMVARGQDEFRMGWAEPAAAENGQGDACLRPCDVHQSLACARRAAGNAEVGEPVTG